MKISQRTDSTERNDPHWEIALKVKKSQIGKAGLISQWYWLVYIKGQIPILDGWMTRLRKFTLCCNMYTPYITIFFSYIYYSLMMFSANASSQIVLELNFTSCVLWCLSICIKTLGVTWNGWNKEGKCPLICVTTKSLFTQLSRGKWKTFVTVKERGLCILWTASNHSSNFLTWHFDLNANWHFPIFHTFSIVFNQLTHMLQYLVYS